jgi:hypothetical protein
LKGHATIEKGQSILRISFALGGAYFAFGGILFLQMA